MQPVDTSRRISYDNIRGMLSIWHHVALPQHRPLLPQVTPSSKVVGDLAQFMVQNDLDETKLVEKASNLNLPDRSASHHSG